jgi:uncharacterized protein
MIGHLKASDFKEMAWANGKGKTVEMWRQDRNGAMLWRLSRAAVVENGAFSLFPGVDRNLTVISGPGFDLAGDVTLRADPMQPVAFAGDITVSAANVLAPCEDFNVMVRRGAMRAEVRVCDGGVTAGMAALFALAPVMARGIAMAPHELLLTDEALRFDGRAILVRLHEAASAQGGQQGG